MIYLGIIMVLFPVSLTLGAISKAKLTTQERSNFILCLWIMLSIGACGITIILRNL